MFSLNSLVGIEFKYLRAVGSRRFSASDENMFEIGSVIILIRLPEESADIVDTMKKWCDGARLEIVCPDLDEYCI